ncbi:amino acid adenylation domain-containing protein [Rhizobium rhizogenes]|uniref:non-ribosomal peptide synthetase n=1 Tax=Rhizobium rhizogenes TaxID=359 RepID=UPI003ED14F38
MESTIDPVRLPNGQNFYSQISTWAQTSPTSAAICYKQQVLTYAELDERSNKIARWLKTMNIGRGSLVGVLMERRPDTLVCLLGILKSGAAYVPIDPTFPSDRIAYVLRDSRLHLLLSENSLRERIMQRETPTLFLESQMPSILMQDGSGVASCSQPLDRAYVLYTSGSTGNPKGVEIPRRALDNFIDSMHRVPGINAWDRLLSVTTLSFDISGLEMFLPLYGGATVVIADENDVVDGKRLAQMLRDFDITIMQATPATWLLMIDAGWTGKPGLKALCGGEAMPRELANSLLRRCDSVWNMYGPTETTIWSTVARVTAGEGVVSIGRAIDNTDIQILDEHLAPVKAGEVGEIYIGGLGLAIGYLGKPELTKERFLNQKTEDGSTVRIYRTGDLGRLYPDGRIECLGRSDSQVKLRGYRIELGEIEAALEGLPNVQRAVVVLKENSSTDRFLMAFYMSSQDAVSATELRSGLSKTLPEYMVPIRYELVASFPLTLNGKVDRKALAERHVDRGSTRNIVPPSTPLEREVAAIWEELLRLEGIGIHESFIELGGHSLLINAMVHRLNRTFNIDLSLIEVLRNGQTIAEIVSLVEERVMMEASDDDIKAALGVLETLSSEELDEFLKAKAV